MNKNEAKRKLLRLFVPVVFCMIGALSMQVRAEDAFVVEEEAVIGGENVQEEAAPVTAPVQKTEESSSPGEKKAATPKKPKTGKKIEKEPESGEAQEPVSVSENVVSQNSVSPPFRTPVRKQETRPEKKDADKQKETESREHTIPEAENVLSEEPKAEEISMQISPWWLLGTGGAFFLGGCARIVWRVKSGRKKNNIV